MQKVFRNYEIGDKLGAGGMATVYRGRHLTLDSAVAIKILHRELAFDQTFISRFELEARSAAAIDSPHIVKVIDFGSEDGVYFIVMEFVGGEDLGRIMARLREAGVRPPLLPPEISLLVLTDVAVGLKAAHAQHIIHRDIKPSNILLDGHGLVRIADFGLVRDGRPVGDLNLTRTGTVLGTPAYMSPEQASGEPLDHRTDVFSLGVVAYELLAGHKPFTGDTPSEILQQIVEVPAPPLDDRVAPWVTDDMRRLLARALAKDPDKRYPDMNALLVALRGCQAGLDPGGQLSVTKYDLLGGFAGDAVNTRGRIHKLSVDNHLRRGLRFKDMGMAKLHDALFELRYVTALDPGNSKARKVLSKLEKKARDSTAGMDVARRSGSRDENVTEVLPSGRGSDAPTEPLPVHAARRRWPWLMVALLVVLGVVWGMQQRRGGSEEVEPVVARPDTTIGGRDSVSVEARTDTVAATTPQEPPTERITAPPQDDDPPADVAAAEVTPPVEVERREEKPAVTEPAARDPEPTPAPAAPEPGRLRFTVADSCRVTLDGEVVFRGLGEGEVEMEPGRDHRALFLFPRTRAEVVHADLVVGSGRDLDLGTVEPALGILNFGANMEVDLSIDGRPVARGQRRLLNHVLAVGEHSLGVSRTGYRVREVRADGQPLEPVVGPTGDIGYRFTITEQEELRIHVRLE